MFGKKESVEEEFGGPVDVLVPLVGSPDRLRPFDATTNAIAGGVEILGELYIF